MILLARLWCWLLDHRWTWATFGDLSSGMTGVRLECTECLAEIICINKSAK